MKEVNKKMCLAKLFLNNDYNFHELNYNPVNINNKIQTLLKKTNNLNWILNINIKKRFNNIYYNWLLENTLVEKKIIKNWLAQSENENDNLFPIKFNKNIALKLINLSLNGLEKYIKIKLESQYSVKNVDFGFSKIKNFEKAGCSASHL